ncbi:MAG: glycosyl transferase group 1 [Actinomycetia bacterium]|nr:glycosyl transferase group 1 [Actinomycetes bacterium]
MRIALIGPAFPYKGGGAHHTTELAHRLATAGHSVTLESWKAQYPSFLYPGQQTIDEPEGTPFPGTHRRLSWRRPDGWLRLGRDLGNRAGRRLGRDRGDTDPFDLVILAVLSPVQVPSYLGILAGLRRRTRVVALCHNVLPHERTFYDEPLMKALLRRVDGILVHSEEQAALVRTLTTRPVQVAEMPAHFPTPGTSTDRDLRVVPEARRQALHVDGNREITTAEGDVHNRLLFFGIIRPYKGLDVLLRALAAGPSEVALTVAGEFWGGLEETRALIAELGLAERVELRPGYAPAADVPGLFAAADALVLPYRSATASQNVWMAYEHGVPVIATRVGSFVGQIRDGEDGLLCEPDDVASLTEALKRFYAPGEPARLRAGVSPVDSEPVWNAYLSTLLEQSGHRQT